jgi:hypothetical protein
MALSSLAERAHLASRSEGIDPYPRLRLIATADRPAILTWANSVLGCISPDAFSLSACVRGVEKY